VIGGNFSTENCGDVVLAVLVSGFRNDTSEWWSNASLDSLTIDSGASWKAGILKSALVALGCSLGSGGFTRKSMESFDLAGDNVVLGLQLAEAGGVMSAARVGDDGDLNTMSTFAWALQ
jgi:hypothetical protein